MQRGALYPQGPSLFVEIRHRDASAARHSVLLLEGACAFRGPALSQIAERSRGPEQQFDGVGVGL